ncbi:MAG: molybdopterin cofactor-binding domain-containing protein, partial [Dehalococcoidia bacterium]
TAHEAISIYDSGAFGGYKPGGHLGGAASAGGPYHVPNGRVVEHQVYTNTVPCGYMRGPGEPQAMFEVESQMDCVARAIGMDPVEFRRKNLVRNGESDAIGNEYQDVRALEVLEEAVKESGYDKPKQQDPVLKYGRGIAIGDRSQGGGQTQASVTLNADGSVVIHTSVFEQGSGSYTVMQQIVADRLGVPLDRVTVRVWDTLSSPGYDNGIGGSRVTRMAGQAVLDAAEAASTQMYTLAAELLGWPDDKLQLDGDNVSRTDTGESQSWAELLSRTGNPVTGFGAVNDTVRNPFTSFTAQVADVAVDPETGQVKLLKMTTVHDTGTVFNPIGFHGQINGGLVQGIGYALTEEIVVEDGRVSTLSFADYKLPSIADLPELKTVVLKAKEGYGPYHIKGIGEHSNAQTAPAIINAIEDAVGVRIHDLPATAEKVYRLLKEEQ